MEVRHGRGEKLEIARRARNVHGTRHMQGLAGVHAFRMCQRFQFLLDALGDGEQQPGALGNRRARPDGEGAGGGLVGVLDIAHIAVGHPGDDGGGGGIDLVEGLAG